MFSLKKNTEQFRIYIKTLVERFEDPFTSLAIYIVMSRQRTTNYLERLKEEVRREEKVIRIFPNEDPASLLISSPSSYGDKSSYISMSIGQYHQLIN